MNTHVNINSMLVVRQTVDPALDSEHFDFAKKQIEKSGEITGKHRKALESTKNVTVGPQRACAARVSQGSNA